MPASFGKGNPRGIGLNRATAYSPGVNQLIVFVKAPRPGTVKTRLASALGPIAAAAAYRRLAELTLSSLTALPNVELRFSPDDALAEITPWLRRGWQARPQGNGNLGARLHAAFADAFDAGNERVAIVGSDCPTLTIEDVREAWASLAANDVVLGPAADGGYWLIGLRQPRPALFDQIAWSTASVFDETVRRAAQMNLRVHRLREQSDIDTERDWLEFLKHFDTS